MFRDEMNVYRDENNQPFFCIYVSVEKCDITPSYYPDLNFSFPDVALKKYTEIYKKKKLILFLLEADETISVKTHIDELAELIKKENELELLYIPEQFIKNNELYTPGFFPKGRPEFKFWQDFYENMFDQMQDIAFMTLKNDKILFKVMTYILENHFSTIKKSNVTVPEFINYLNDTHLDIFLEDYDSTDIHEIMEDDDELIITTKGVNGVIKSYLFFKNGIDFVIK